MRRSKTLSSSTLNKLLVIICVTFGNVSCLTQLDKYEFDELTGFWMKFHEIPANFTDAFLRCKAEGAMLISPSNETLTKSMTNLLAKKNTCVSCAVYTGINAFFSKGDYSTAEGVPLSAIPASWAPGAPDNFQNGEDCLVMLSNGKLDDIRCNATYPYICYKSIEDDLANPACGTNDLAYTLDARTGSCYKFHNIGTNWVRAYMTCSAEGAYLAIPNSQTEANVFKEIFARNPDSNIFATFKSVVGLGFHDQYQHRMFMTIKGQTIQEAGYADFSDGQPDNAQQFDGGEHCGSMYRNGGLNDVWCYSVTIPFLCEKDPTFIYI